MNALATLPVALPLLTALLGLTVLRSGRLRRVALLVSPLVSVLAGVLLVAATWDGSAVVSRIGGWEVPYGVVFVADSLAAAMVLFVAVAAFGCVAYSMTEKSAALEHPLRLPLVFFLLAGVNLALLTGDLFNLFVAFEVMLLASYGLVTLEADDRQVPRAFPYVAINIVGSTVFLSACGLAYGLFGTLNFAELADRMRALPAGDGRVALLAGLLFVVVAVKSAFLPFVYWLPSAYPVLPPALAGLFGGLLTKVGVYVLLRLFATVLPPDLGVLRDVLLVAAAASMVVGGLAALSRYRIQEILAWHIVSQVGFMGVAAALGSATALAAAVAITVHNILVKTSLLLVGGTVARLCGTDELARTGGLWRAAPFLGVLFLLQALSLAGIPPLSGFWGKYLLLVAGAGEGAWVILALALFASFLTLASMLKIWIGAFWKDAPEGAPTPPRLPGAQRAIAVLTLAALACGLAAEPFGRLCVNAGRAAGDSEAYVRHVRDAALVAYPDKEDKP